jgi:hypothetical protein
VVSAIGLIPKRISLTIFDAATEDLVMASASARYFTPERNKPYTDINPMTKMKVATNISSRVNPDWDDCRIM